jgi:hypothetical protein
MSEIANDRFNPMDYQQAFSWPRLMTPWSSWVPLIPFGMAVVEMCQPGRIVELGTYHGDSYCAMCQAVEQLKLPTRCTAVDTWTGDAQAGRLGPEVLAALKAHHDPLYSSFSNLLQMTFDEALAHVPDGSVDLLHIDGLHTYDAVSHDYNTWKPKLSERGVMMFHDTQVREAGFGVWTLWEELARQYPHFEVHHAYGLGVLAIGSNVPVALKRFFDLANREPQLVRNFYKLLGDTIDNARTALQMMGNNQRIQQMLDQRKQMIGEQFKPADPQDAFLNPINFQERMMYEVQKVAVAELRHRGFDVRSQPPPARVMPGLEWLK